MLGNTLKIEGHVGGTHWELMEHVENLVGTRQEHNGFNKNPKRETHVLPKEEFANSNYNIPLILSM
jgi:hypothetical protein